MLEAPLLLRCMCISHEDEGDSSRGTMITATDPGILHGGIIDGLDELDTVYYAFCF